MGQGTLKERLEKLAGILKSTEIQKWNKLCSDNAPFSEREAFVKRMEAHYNPEGLTQKQLDKLTFSDIINRLETLREDVYYDAAEATNQPLEALKAISQGAQLATVIATLKSFPSDSFIFNNIKP